MNYDIQNEEHEVKLFVEKYFKGIVEKIDPNKHYYKYVDFYTARKILTNSTLKFSTPLELDDNDLEHSFLKTNAGEDDLCKIKKKAFINVMKNKNYTDEQIGNFINNPIFNEISKTLPSDLLVKETHKVLDTFRSQYSIACLTTSNNNERMWYEYAKKGKGFCIEYKFASLFTKMFTAFKVRYDDNSFDIYEDLEKNLLNFESLTKWLYTKRTVYAFEDEVRLMKVGPCFLPLPKEIFTGIYYTKNTKQKYIDAIEKLLQSGFTFSKGKKIDYSL